MKQLFLFCFLTVFTCSAYAQQHALTKQWDKRFGGTLSDDVYSCIQTFDGGYLLGGGSYSGIAGDKTQDNWDTSYNTYDYWVVRIDPTGQKMWDKRFGGFNDDGLNSMVQSEDGGFILAGYSASGIGGDRTQTSRGGFDYWIVKIDDSGNKLWDKRFGGFSGDELFAVQRTRDSGVILAGYSYSDSGSDKHQHSWGGTDYWIVKIDAGGNLQWENRYGGFGYDFLYDIKQTNDGGYILGGMSNSGIGGDKTEANCPGSTYNYWVVKIDSAGNKLWDKVYGGDMEEDLRAVLALPDGGFLLGGFSYSGISGNKTTPNQGAGAADYWIVKIDSTGAKLWDKDFGGSSEDKLWSLALTQDGGYLLGGDSGSPRSGNKSENNTALSLSWIVKLDSLGNQQWDKTIFANDLVGTCNAFQTVDDCYMIASFTRAEIGYYKTQPSWDSSSDDWIVKFCDTLINDIAQITDKVQVSIYPNPFTTDIAIAIQKGNLHQATFTITNPLGQIIYTQQENNLSPTYTKMLDLSYLPNGVYFVAVVVDGERITREVIKSPL